MLLAPKNLLTYSPSEAAKAFIEQDAAILQHFTKSPKVNAFSNLFKLVELNSSILTSKTFMWNYSEEFQYDFGRDAG